MFHVGTKQFRDISAEDGRHNLVNRAIATTTAVGLATLAFVGIQQAPKIAEAFDNSLSFAEPEHGSLDPLEPTKVFNDENGTTYVYGPLGNDQCSPLKNSNEKFYYFTKDTDNGVQSWWATDSNGQERIDCGI